MEMTDKVLIDNLCNWPLYFRRLNGMGDIRIPALAKNYSALDVAEVQMQIQNRNKMFIGDDDSRMGDHARLYIVNDAQRKMLLGIPDESDDDAVVLTVDTIKKLFAIRKKDDFNTALANLVKTDAEKKMVVSLAKEAGGDEVAAWKMDAINALAKTVAL